MSGCQDEFKSSVARSFGRAALTYDDAAVLQRRIGTELLDYVSPLIKEVSSPLILDLGAGTGFFTCALAELAPNARVVAVDLAESMAKRASLRHQGGCVVGDAEALPIASGVVDLIFSNMCIQWCRDPVRLCKELGRVLKPGGKMIFSTFGPKTLKELRDAWSVSDGFDHVIDFLSEERLMAVFEQAGFVWESRMARVDRCIYPDVFALMRELKDLGARNASLSRSRSMTGKGRIEAMIKAYSGEVEGGIAASYEILGGCVALGAGVHA